MFRGICPTEVYDEIMSLKIAKSALDIPGKCIKHAANHIYDALSMVFNQSLLQGIFPENFRIARNNGIISKLRHYLTLLQMKQIYYSLIYPYISYATLAWGSVYKTHIDKIQTKQNHSARLIFFTTTYGEHTESALPMLNLLDVIRYIMFIDFRF